MEQQDAKTELSIKTRVQTYNYVEQGEVGRNTKEISLLPNQKKVRVPF
jgi:hypothetical protein